jgi:rootletin
VILSLQDELKKFHIKFEDAAIANDRDLKILNDDIEQLRQQKQIQNHENFELKTQLKLTEDNRDQLKRDLIEANRRIREDEENIVLQRKEIQDLKRYLQDEQRDKELSLRSNDELRTKLKSVENEKIDLRQLLEEAKQRIIGKEFFHVLFLILSVILVLDEQRSQVQKDANDLRQNLRDVERSRLEARRELQELRRHVKMLDGETKKKSKELEELADRVRHDEQREEEMRREVFGQKQKFVEAEASREVLRKELANIQRHYVELEDEQRMRERDYKLAVEDARRLGKII